MKKLTNNVNHYISPVNLTKNIETKFILSFKYALEKNYTFSEMQLIDNKHLQKFLNIISKLSFDDVLTKYSTIPDKSDKYNDSQIYHFKVTDKFRIHAIQEQGLFIIIRLDCNHKVHK